MIAAVYLLLNVSNIRKNELGNKETKDKRKKNYQAEEKGSEEQINA
jgi:hypothetical protein